MTSQAKDLDHLLTLPYIQFEISSIEDPTLDKKHYLELLKKVRKTLDETPDLSSDDCLDLCRKERFLMNIYLKKIIQEKIPKRINT
jgi:hypothetical protein